MQSIAAADSADNRIALAISGCMHAALILFVCLPLDRSNSNSGLDQSVGTSDLVVQFTWVQRAAPPRIESAAVETERLEELPKTEGEVVEPVVSEAPMPLDAAASEDSSPPQPSTVSMQEDAAGDESGIRGEGDDLETRYVSAVKAAIYSKWKRSTAGDQTGTCELVVKQAVGGSVLSAQTINCSLAPSEQDALEAAALMAQPLPYAGFESVFLAERTVRVDL